MYDLIRVLPTPRLTPTRAMPMLLVRCQHCGVERELPKQHAYRANRERRAHCPTCLPGTFHNMTGSRPYRIWRGMVSRCTDPASPDWLNYGARGITVAPEWLRFAAFWRDMQSGYANDLTIERVNNMGSYCRANCCWAPNMEQQANKRSNRLVTWRGAPMHLAAFCRAVGVTRGAITPYLKRNGWQGEAALAEYSQSPYPRFRAPRS